MSAVAYTYTFHMPTPINTKIHPSSYRLSFSKLFNKTSQTSSNASTKYTHKSHMRAVAYTYMFHRPIHINPKILQSSYHFAVFQRIQDFKAKPS